MKQKSVSYLNSVKSSFVAFLLFISAQMSQAQLAAGFPKMWTLNKSNYLRFSMKVQFFGLVVFHNKKDLRS